MHCDYYDIDRLVKDRKKIKKVFFYRICGTGMGAAACLLKEKGLHVEGADTRFYPPMSDYLEKSGINCIKLEDLDEVYMRQFDLVVVGNVVPKISDDAKFIESLGIAFCSFPTAIGAFVLKDQNVVGIAGTHGKTTTTYFFTQVFEELEQDPGYFIGGVLEEGRPSSKIGAGHYFFIESDEYDSAYFEKYSKFRSYFLNSMILTSLEFDHADIFKDLQQIKNEFSVVLPKLSKYYIYNSDYAGVKELNNENSLESLRQLEYGQTTTTGPQIIQTDSEGTMFSLRINGKEELFKTNLIGVHNILNISTVIIFALNEQFELNKVKESILNLKMVRRRQEIRGKYQGSTVIDDFAHHPTAVYLTLDGIKSRYSDKKITVIFEPNSATARSNIFQDDFFRALKRADNIIITKLERPTSVKNHEDFDCEKVVADLVSEGKRARNVANLESLMDEINTLAGDDNIFLVLSNGTCLGLWESEFVERLQK